ncbi:MAG: hypothetical protein H7Y16_01485 [Candidatus Parcubacteria bacterium]|nr:hypothetical protein [Burkholderiales bacterium]
MSANHSAAIKEELVPGSDSLFVIFGGIAGAVGMPPFEFYRTSRILDDSKIFLRDPRQAWYQRGIASVGDDVYAIRDLLRDRIAAAAPSKVRFIGNSMGGYAAILLCAMLKVGRAIAFSPQTFVSPERRLESGDERWHAPIAEMHRHRTQSHIYELRSWLRRHDPDIQADVYVSRNHALDWLHARELEGFANIRLHEFGLGEHNLVRHFRDAGTLHAILKS